MSNALIMTHILVAFILFSVSVTKFNAIWHMHLSTLSVVVLVILHKVTSELNQNLSWLAYYTQAIHGSDMLTVWFCNTLLYRLFY